MLGLTLGISYYNSLRSRQNGDKLIAINKQLVTINEQQKDALDATQKDIYDLKQTLLCIGIFFNYPNRQNLKIDSYTPCVITDTTTGVTETIQTQQTTSQSTTPNTLTSPAIQQNSRSSSPKSTPKSNQKKQNLLQTLFKKIFR